jgi:hypothetical protein
MLKTLDLRMGKIVPKAVSAMSGARSSRFSSVV